MKFLSIPVVCAVTLFIVNSADAQKKKRKRNSAKQSQAKVISQDISGFVFKKDLWDTQIASFAAAPENKVHAFEWQTGSKRKLRSEGLNSNLLGIRSGEVVIISDAGAEIRGVSVSFYNKGDNGFISGEELDNLENKVSTALSDKLGEQPKVEEIKTTVVLDRSTWELDGTSYQLEKSFSERGDPEFLRLRLISSKQANSREKTAGRSSLRSNVVKNNETGEVYIQNIPMVDQGRKGYCACASAARIYQYYGRSTDQHEIAQLAGSSAARGTTITSMVTSLKNATSKLNSRVNVLYEYPKNISDANQGNREILSGLKDMMRDVNSYQQLAKKNKKASIVIGGDKDYPRVSSKQYISFQSFISQCDPETYREVMMKKSSFSRFESKIKEYIDQGIPVAWCLQLGLFPEPGLPQARGGHMRLITGYNKEKKEIIYSDSWGKGHEKKSMDSGKAFSMTNVILVLPPTR